MAGDETMARAKTKIEIEHWKCSGCNVNLTFTDDLGCIEHHTHFDISRSNKEFEIIEGCIEEQIGNRNEKMLRQFCEECFTKILNESNTLGKHFYNKELNKFIY